jgi:large subunit ribosomal protein L13
MENKKIFIDAENAVAGRLASFCAKKALEGNEIIIFNSEKSLIKGDKKEILESFLVKLRRGGQIEKGPYYPKTTERILKRIIRGMLPYKKERGKSAYKRIKCYVGDIDEKIDEVIKLGDNEKGFEGIRLGELSKLMSGGKTK